MLHVDVSTCYSSEFVVYFFKNAAVPSSRIEQNMIVFFLAQGLMDTLTDHLKPAGFLSDRVIAAGLRPLAHSHGVPYTYYPAFESGNV